MTVPAFVLFGLFLGGLLFVLLGVQIARAARRPEEPSGEAEGRPRLTELAPGEGPATALRVSDAAALGRCLQAQRCGCGVEGTGEAEVRPSPLVLGGRALTSMRWECDRCTAVRTVYFELTAA
jgi:hypothetical protein